MRLPLLKAVSATALALLPLLAPTVGGLALTPGLATAALAACIPGTPGNSVFQRGCHNPPAILNTQPHPCAGAMTGDPRLQRGRCNIVRMPINGRDGGPERMPSVQDASRVPVNRGGL